MTATDDGTDHSGKGGTVPFFLDPVAAISRRPCRTFRFPGRKPLLVDKLLPRLYHKKRYRVPHYQEEVSLCAQQLRMC
jgi:hypothetical protein